MAGAPWASHCPTGCCCATTQGSAPRSRVQHSKVKRYKIKDTDSYPMMLPQISDNSAIFRYGKSKMVLVLELFWQGAWLAQLASCCRHPVPGGLHRGGISAAQGGEPARVLVTHTCTYPAVAGLQNSLKCIYIHFPFCYTHVLRRIKKKNSEVESWKKLQSPQMS